MAKNPVNSAEAKPAAASATTNVHVNPAPAKPQSQPIEQVAKPEPVAIPKAEQVTVKAIRSFHGEEGFKNPQSEPFVVSRARAADMLAVGIVEVVDGKK